MRTYLVSRPRAAGLLLTLVVLCLLPLAHRAAAQPLKPVDFASLGTLGLSVGSFTIDTDSLTIVDDAAPGVPLFTGVADDQNGTADYFNGVWVPGSMGIPEIAVFTFDDIDLQSTANITVTGTRALALLSHGNAMIDTTIDLSGESVATVTSPDPAPAGVGRFGGFGGGFAEFGLPGEVGDGPGGGPGSNIVGGSGGFGGTGLRQSVIGPTYGDLLGGPLQGGSGGGSVNNVGLGGAAGGGALEISAIGSVTLGTSGSLIAAGGMVDTVYSIAELGGGAGSGGGIRIQGQSVDLLGSIDAHAFKSGPFSVLSFGGGGGVAVFGLNQLFDFMVGVTDPSTINTSMINVEGGNLFSNTRGLISVIPQVTSIPSGQSLTLGEVTDLTDANRRLELVHHDVRVQQGGEAVVPIEGYVNRGRIELFPGDSRILGPGTLDNRSELSGSGTVEAIVDNNAGGTIDAINDVFTFTATVTNNPGAQINAINSTLSFDAGLTNNGELNLINTTIVGSVASSVTGSTTLVGSNSLSGDFAMSPADSLFVGLGGVLSGQFDTLAVGGDATIAGTLNVSLDPGFTPQPGDSFAVVTYGSHGGEFASITGLDFGGGMSLKAIYDSTELRLVVLLPGDGNGDGMVDGLDYLLWAGAFGDDPAMDPPGSPENGDYNDDGVVNGLDYLVWAGNFGAGTTVAVPEPASLSSLVLGCVAVAIRRRNRCRR